jgi:segregation and condensation protein A
MNAARAYSLPHVGFEGPLEHLLELIQKRKLLINDVSLASVADEYIAYARAHEEHPVSETADFIHVASTLLLIKSKSLLPVFELTESEEGDIKDLEHRLKLYQMFRELADDIQSTYGTTVLYERSYVPTPEPLFITDPWTTTTALHTALHELISHLPKNTLRPVATVRKVISLEEMITSLEERILRQVTMRFSDIRNTSPDHKTTIVSFLAILELVKQGFVSVRQEARFEEIHIEKEGTDTPRYQ